VKVQVSKAQLTETFRLLRDCGRSNRECQVLWVSAWHDSDRIARVVHSQHSGHTFGFRLKDSFINQLWLELAASRSGVRVQVHTHPQEAFHSRTDDKWPIVHTVGFLSLVIPNFALGREGLDGAYLASIEANGSWKKLEPSAVIEVT
jgi:hypothetical protein